MAGLKHERLSRFDLEASYPEVLHGAAKVSPATTYLQLELALPTRSRTCTLSVERMEAVIGSLKAVKYLARLPLGRRQHSSTQVKKPRLMPARPAAAHQTVRDAANPRANASFAIGGGDALAPLRVMVSRVD